MIPAPNRPFSSHYGGKIFHSAMIAVLLCLLSTVVISVFLMALVPPIMRDELIHHLAVPKMWINKGAIYQIPHLVSSYYPMNLDLLYMIPLYFGNDIIPKFIHFSFGLLTAWLLYIYLISRVGRPFALLGALLFLTTPVILKLSISAYVDLGLAFFAWTSLYYLLKWKDESNRLKFLIYAALYCGLGLGTKYNGLIILLIYCSLIPILYLKNNQKTVNEQLKAVGYSALFFLISMSVFSPWMLKNYIWTGNPVYPLYEEKISNNNKTLRFSVEPLLQRKIIYNETPMQTVLIPVRIFFEGKDDDPKLFDGRLNPFLLLFAIIPLALKNKDGTVRFEQAMLGSFSLLFLLMVYFTTDMRMRYVVPILPPLVALTIFGILAFAKRTQRIERRLLHGVSIFVFSAAVYYMLAINGSYLIGLFRDINPIPHATGKISREMYLTNRLPEYATIEYSNTIHRQENKLLGLFLGRKGYYFKSDIIFMMNDFKAVVEHSPPETELIDFLIKNKFTHVIVGIRLFEAWVHRNFDDKMKSKIDKLFAEDLKLVYTKNGYALFEAKIPANV